MDRCASWSTGRRSICGSTRRRRASRACSRVACRGRRRTPGRGLAGDRGQRNSLRDHQDLPSRERRTGGLWTAFVPPRHFRPGANEVDGLRRCRRTRRRPARARLLLEQAARDVESGVTRRTRLLVGACRLAFTGGKGGPEHLPVDERRRGGCHPARSQGRAAIASHRHRSRPRRHAVDHRRERLHRPQRAGGRCAVVSHVSARSVPGCSGTRVGRPHHAEESARAGEATGKPKAGRSSRGGESARRSMASARARPRRRPAPAPPSPHVGRQRVGHRLHADRRVAAHRHRRRRGCAATGAGRCCARGGWDCASWDRVPCGSGSARTIGARAGNVTPAARSHPRHWIATAGSGLRGGALEGLRDHLGHVRHHRRSASTIACGSSTTSLAALVPLPSGPCSVSPTRT